MKLGFIMKFNALVILLILQSTCYCEFSGTWASRMPEDMFNIKIIFKENTYLVNQTSTITYYLESGEVGYGKDTDSDSGSYSISDNVIFFNPHKGAPLLPYRKSGNQYLVQYIKSGNLLTILDSNENPRFKLFKHVDIKKENQHTLSGNAKKSQ